MTKVFTLKPTCPSLHSDSYSSWTMHSNLQSLSLINCKTEIITFHMTSETIKLVFRVMSNTQKKSMNIIENNY